MGYSLAKKKGGRHTRGALISSRDTILLANNVSSDNSENEDYSPTPIVRITQPKKRDSKIALNSNFFLFLCPGTFVTQMFARGHSPVYYSEEEMAKFDASFQK